MKLNLGCGDDVKEGYINIDVRKTKPNDGGSNIICHARKP
jgi:hypothetical protein